MARSSTLRGNRPKRTKQDKALARRLLGTLRSHRVRPRTLRRYETAVSLFFVWAEAVFGEIPDDAGTLDAVLAEYAEALWQEGESRYLLGDTLSGLSHFVKMLKHCMPDAWAQYDTWGTLEPAQRATPLTLPILLGMVGVALSRQEHAMAAGMLLAFQGLLRTGEVMGLVKSNFTFALGAGQMIIDLGLTKSGKRRNESEQIIVRDSTLTAFVYLCLEASRPGDRLLPTEATFRGKFEEYLKTLKLHQCNFLPYSLRRGGATHLFFECGSMETVRTRGRWASYRTAKLYVDQCKAATTEFALTPTQRQLVDKWKNHALSILLD